MVYTQDNPAIIFNSILLSTRLELLAIFKCFFVLNYMKWRNIILICIMHNSYNEQFFKTNFFTSKTRGCLL